MLNLIRELFDCLTVVQKRRLLYLQVMIVIMSILEVTGIALIGPFLAYVVNEDKNLGIFGFVNKIAVVDSSDLILYLGVFILVLLFISTIVSILTTFLLAMFSAKTGAELSDRLFKYYCEQDVLFHNAKNTSLITKNLSTETIRMTDLVINPFMQMNAKIVLCVFILGFIFIVDPFVALTGVSLFIIIYYMIYLFVKTKLYINGRDLTQVIGQRFLTINECFGGINEVILSNKTKFYHDKYIELGKLYSKTRGANHAISLAPRYLVEMIAYGAIISVILVYLTFYPYELNSFINLIAMYAIASLKLLPALQQIFTSTTQIRGNISSFMHLKDDLLASNVVKEGAVTYELSGFESVEFQNVNFKYPSKTNCSITEMSLRIVKNECVAFVGPSGSGKSTLVNILLGLLIPNDGRVCVNGSPRGFDLYKNRACIIGYVPQNIYLTDNTILENIAFGVDPENIDLSRVNLAVISANLGDFLDSLEFGLETHVGERGVQISGGQKQRIGIARALYNDPEILIFDEATSALDGNSEKLILESINSVLHKKTIIMIAHRLNTVKKCDTIHVMANGEIVDSGSYEELISNNKMFQGMVNNA
jgi:ATP-binding cassette, subfamily B, bacterial PglK